MNFDIGSVVLCEKHDGNWWAIQPDGRGKDSALSGFEVQSTFGFASRPVERNEDGACNALYAFTGSCDGFAWVGHDPRFSDKCPTLAQGSSAQWNSVGAFSLLDTETNTYQLYVPRGSSAHSLVLGEDANGAESFEVRTASGALLSHNADGWMIRSTGSAFVNVLPNEVAVNGSLNVSASLTVGSLAAQPVVNFTALGILLTTLTGALNALTPITPYEIGLHAALLAFTGAYAAACPTQNLYAS